MADNVHVDVHAATVLRRAVEAAIWGTPAVNFLVMAEAALGAGCDSNEIAYWSRPLDWHNQTLTPNPDAISLMPFISVHEGPVVLDIPAATDDAAIIGSVMDAWQVPLGDVGSTGRDVGEGGRYLLTPPGWDEPAPAGFFELACPTNRAYALLRSSIRSGSDADVSTAVDYALDGVKLYRYDDSVTSPPTAFHDMSDVLFDATIPFDVRFYDLLDRFVKSEPWQERDRAMIDMLRSVGITKDSEFAPTAAGQELLGEAIGEARRFLDAQYESFFAEPFFPGTAWALPSNTELATAAGSGFTDPDSYPVDARSAAYYWAFATTEHTGADQFYLMATRDNTGAPLHGSLDYQLNVPADAPVDLYWSLTGYDRETHALIREVGRPSRSSTSPGLQTNDDGTVDLHIGPNALAGRESNWLPTSSGHSFEVLMRFYGPQPALSTKSWQLPDIVRAAEPRTTGAPS